MYPSGSGGLQCRMKPGGGCLGIAHFSLPDGHLSTLHLKSLSVVAIIFQSFFFFGLGNCLLSRVLCLCLVGGGLVSLGGSTFN